MPAALAPPPASELPPATECPFPTSHVCGAKPSSCRSPQDSLPPVFPLPGPVVLTSAPASPSRPVAPGAHVCPDGGPLPGLSPHRRPCLMQTLLRGPPYPFEFLLHAAAGRVSPFLVPSFATKGDSVLAFVWCPWLSSAYPYFPPPSTAALKSTPLFPGWSGVSPPGRRTRGLRACP